MAAVEGGSDIVVGLETPIAPELDIYVAELDGIAVDTVVDVLADVPGYVGASRDVAGCSRAVVTVVFELESLDIVIAETTVLDFPTDVGTLAVAFAPGRMMVLEADGFVEDVGIGLG